METQRFYLKNLPDTANENELKKKLSQICDIFDVTLKNNYGFFSVQLPHEQVEEVIKKCSKIKWNGNMITISKAKRDNFMARLENERKVAKDEIRATNDKKTMAVSPPKQRMGELDDELEENSGIPKFRGVQSSIDYATSKDEKNTMDQFKEFNSIWGDDESVMTDKKFSSYLSNDDGNSNTSKLKKCRTSEKSPFTKSEKKKRDDERRRLSLADKEKERKKQQNLIKSALGGYPKNKKIVFSDDDIIDNNIKKKNLFDNNEEEEFMINENTHFAGDSGKKLLQLQCTFNCDERFKLDARFVDDQPGNQDPPIARPSSMVRFDPSTRKLDIQETSIDQIKVAPVAKITTPDKYYEVSDTIKLALQKKSSGFSLLSAYGTTLEKEINVNDCEPTVIKEPRKRNHFICSDSSDDDDDANKEVQHVQYPTSLWNAPILCATSSHKFFFDENDSAFPEAMQFINKRNSTESKAYAENYDSTRQILRRIFKDQSLRRIKKNDMFKKKLGGARTKNVYKAQGKSVHANKFY